MIKGLVALMLLSTLPTFLYAQDKIETDRPTEALNAELVLKGIFQPEIGFRIEKKKKDDLIYQYPDAVFRYGLLNRLELRLRTNVETQRFRLQGVSNDGLKPVELGLKAALFQTNDTGFISSLYGQVGFPRLASKEHQDDKTFYRLRLLLQNKLTQKIKLNYNIGRDWDSDEKEQNWIYAFSPEFELSEKWVAFLEGYGTFQKGSQPEHYIDGGFAYNISYNVRLDINAGKGLNRNASDYFITTGISFKL